MARQGSSLMAFTVPNNKNNIQGCVVGAAHVDSPCLRVRPRSMRPSMDGFVQVGVETYGGGLWHTWFDRDLALAGRIITQDPISGHLTGHLVDSKRAVMRIPTLAIHLDRSVVSDGFKFNNETHLLPVLATELLNKNELTGGNHNEALMRTLLPQNKADEKIMSLDLCLYDAQPASIGGLHDEFVFAGRLDNLEMSYCIMEAFLQASRESNDVIKAAVWFDHEEVGSGSAVGAEGGLFERTMERISDSLALNYESLMAQSLIVSADMAHAAHPNYPEKHERTMRPGLHRGVVIKYNAQQRYATSAYSAAVVKHICMLRGLPLQEFEVRNDSPCGSTIGPMLGAGTGALCIDVGLAQLSMHSIREMSSVEDVDHGVAFMQAVYSDYSVNILSNLNM